MGTIKKLNLKSLLAFVALVLVNFSAKAGENIGETVPFYKTDEGQQMLIGVSVITFSVVVAITLVRMGKKGEEDTTTRRQPITRREPPRRVVAKTN